MRWAWHAREAAAAERANRWFTAAFHLRQLLDHEPGSSDLRVRRLRARAQLASSAAARRPPVIPAEMLLADLYYLVERPESLAPLLDREQVGRLENSLLLCERKILSR
jgi:hypothetical protein